MNIAETVTVMRIMIRASTRRMLLRSCSVSGWVRPRCADTDPFRATPWARGRLNSDRDRGTPRSRREHAHARRNDLEVLVVARPVLRRRLADDLGEARTERAERRAADCNAGVGHRRSLTQESLCALDSSRHEIGVGSLAIRGTELAREVRG